MAQFAIAFNSLKAKVDDQMGIKYFAKIQQVTE